MDLLMQRLADGLSDGIIFALMALAIVLVYRSTGIINFAQGEMATLCAFATWALASAGLHIWLAIGAGICCGFVLGVVTERVVLRPFAQGDHLRMALATMGLLLIFNTLTALLFGTSSRPLDSPFRAGTFEILGARVTWVTLGQASAVLVVGLLLWLLFTRTTLGLTLRSSSMSPESSSLLGIDVNRNLMWGWGLAASLGALAAILIAPTLYLSPNMMFNVTLYGFTAAVVGGLDSTIGAVAGGLLVGLVQSFSAGYIPYIGTQLQLVAALVVVVGVLLIRPQGLFGAPRLERV